MLFASKGIKLFKFITSLFKHKWYVGCECFREGLYWRGLVHDLDKFLPGEFIPYMKHFFGSEEKKYEFDYARLLHQHHNNHHWQRWVVLDDDGCVKPLPIPDKCRREILCDWIGAGKVRGKTSPKNDKYYEVRQWYLRGGYKMVINGKTRKWLHAKLEIDRFRRNTKKGYCITIPYWSFFNTGSASS